MFVFISNSLQSSSGLFIDIYNKFQFQSNRHNIWPYYLQSYYVYSVFYVENATDVGGLSRRVSTFSEVGERDNSTVTMLKISTTKRVPNRTVSVGSHSISCAMIFLFSPLHVTLDGNGKFCTDRSTL